MKKNVERIIMSGEALDKHSLSRAANICLRTAREALKELEQFGKIHVVSWQKTYSQHFPVYALGAGASVPRPGGKPVDGRTSRKREAEPIRGELIEPKSEVGILSNAWAKRSYSNEGESE